MIELHPVNWLGNVHTDRILRDLRDRSVSILADDHSIRERYYEDKDCVFAYFKHACILYAREHGCLVLIDDTHQILVGKMDIVGKFDQVLAEEFASSIVPPYVETIERSSKKPFIVVTAYCLPQADYSTMPWELFEKRGEYLGEARVKLDQIAKVN